MPIIPKDQLRALIKEYKLKDANSVQEMLKSLFGDTLKEMLEGMSLIASLVIWKYNYKSKERQNSRNGYSKKKVKSDYGEIDLKIPRDREGEFEPVVVKKNQRDIPSTQDQVLSMYARGMTTRDI